jgi:arsenate reductase (glutaredoxin)
MTQITLYHNPRCSKSRQALALLQEIGVEPTIRLYLQDHPTKEELKTLLAQLGTPVRALLRDGETIYKELDLGRPELSDDELLQHVVQNPILLQRPIAVSDKRAVIARPPELVLELLA